MTKLAQLLIRRPLLFWSFATAILIAGVLAFLQMPKLEDPAVSAKQAMIVVPYPGASAHEVELQVAQVMENELRDLPHVKKVKTECRNGAATFTVEFLMTVRNRDLEQHFDLLRRKVSDAAARLPQGCYQPVVIDDMADVYGIFYALTAQGYDYPEMYRYAKYLRRELQDVKGVKRILIAGNRDETVNITLSKEQIARNGIVPTQIISALQSAGKVVNAGYAAAGGERFAVYVDSAVTDVDGLRDFLIQTLDGKTLRLGDVARIERAYAEPQRNGFFVRGQPALAICIALEEDAIVPDVGKAVDARLAEVMENMPAGFQTEKIFFQPDKVDEAISSFMWNLVESVAIVILVLVFSMGFRSGLIIGFGLVLTVAVSFPILLLCGTTLHRISLGAFIVAMGMLVDNAVVVMDGILVDRQRELGPKTYLFRIGHNTAWPLLGATVIAASTFLCVYLSPDTAGEYARDLFLVLCVSLLASWVLALVQVPFCAASWLPLRPQRRRAQTRAVMNSPVHRAVRGTVGLLIRHKAATLVAAFAVLGAAVLGMTRVKNLFFSDFDYKQFVVECYFPAATNPDTVRSRLLDMSRLLSRNPAVERVAASQGSAPAFYCLVRPMTSGGDCYGELMIDCKDYATVVEQIPAIRRQLRAGWPDAYIRIRKYNFSTSTSHTVEAEFAGPDPAVLRRLSAQAEGIMRRCPYVDPYSVQNNWKPRGKAYVVHYDQPDALRAGIGRGDVANALLAATDGLPVGVLNDQERRITVNLRVREADGSTIRNFGDIPVWSTLNVHMSNEELQSALAGGQGMSDLQDKALRAVPLSAVAGGVSLGWDEDVVLRRDGRRVIEAECDPSPDRSDATPAKVVAAIRDSIEAIPLPPGYSLRWVGEGEVQDEAIGNLMKYVPLTVFIILAILLLLFGSWRKVILILLCLPFALCGIVPSLLATGRPLTFMAIIGMIGLVGMMVKNAIVLVDEINRLQREEHCAPYDALVRATVSRVRPVIMASLTTIVGMIPLVADPMYGSMAITIMGGLTVGTITTLLLLPLIYSALFHIRAPRRAPSPTRTMKPSATVLAFLCLLLAAAPSAAQREEPLSLADCRARALSQSETIGQAQLRAESARLDTRDARTALFPKLDASAIAAYVVPDFDMGGMDFRMRGAYMAGISLSQPLYTGGRIRAGRRLAAIGQRVADEQLRQARMDVIAEADKAYWTYAATCSQVLTLEALVRQLDTLCVQTDAAVRARLAVRADLLSAQARLSDIRYQLQRARRGADLCRQALCNVMGAPTDARFRLTDDPAAPADSLAALLPADSLTSTEALPELRQLRAQVEAGQQQERQARAASLPTVALSAGYSYYGGMKLCAPGAPAVTMRDGVGMALLSVSFPLFHWGENRRKVRRTQLQTDQARLQLRQASRQLSLRASQAATAVVDAQGLVATARTGMEQAEENLRLARARHAARMAALPDLLDAQAQWQQARTHLVEAQTQLRISQTEYLRATGRLEP